MRPKLHSVPSGFQWVGLSDLLASRVVIGVSGKRQIIGIDMFEAAGMMKTLNVSARENPETAGEPLEALLDGWRHCGGITSWIETPTSEIAGLGGIIGLISWFLNSPSQLIECSDTGFVVTLMPGEGLLVPAGFLHAELSVDPSVAFKASGISKADIGAFMLDPDPVDHCKLVAYTHTCC